MKLTNVEDEVMRRIIAGEKVREIASQLGLHRNAISQRLIRCKFKLSARTTYQAIAKYVEKKLRSF